jgi:zinc transporter ZupT
MIAIGIGLHNFGEGLAIGSAYAIGALAIGGSLVIGFALHNTTEGLAVVVPLSGRPVSLRRLLGLGLLAGGPAVAGTLIGSTVVNAELSALLLGVGVGAIVQVIVQIAPSLRDRASGLIDPATYGGLAAGAVLMYATGLLVVV